MFTVIFHSDSNDGDMIEESHVVDEDKFIRFQQILFKIKEVPYLPRIEDYDDRDLMKVLVDYMTAEEAELLSEYTPKSEYGYGTLEKVEFIIGEKQKLWG